jgi:hypothetical protein
MSDMNNWADKMEHDLAHANERARDAEHKAQQLQAELDALKAAHAWIKTSERSPEETCDVLGIVDGVVTLLNYDEFEDDPFVDWSDGTFRGYSVDAVSHWMPLPEAPK